MAFTYRADSNSVPVSPAKPRPSARSITLTTTRAASPRSTPITPTASAHRTATTPSIVCLRRKTTASPTARTPQITATTPTATCNRTLTLMASPQVTPTTV